MGKGVRCRQELDKEHAKEFGVDLKEVGLKYVKNAIINVCTRYKGVEICKPWKIGERSDPRVQGNGEGFARWKWNLRSRLFC